MSFPNTPTIKKHNFLCFCTFSETSNCPCFLSLPSSWVSTPCTFHRHACSAEWTIPAPEKGDAPENHKERIEGQNTSGRTPTHLPHLEWGEVGKQLNLANLKKILMLEVYVKLRYYGTIRSMLDSRIT